jgi:hypothetical protein
MTEEKKRVRKDEPSETCSNGGVNNMVIGTCGFIATGSSAVSDYIKEFSSISALDMFEFVITHGPDGLEDLDYQLNEHCVKYTSSAVAIERFKSNVFNYLIRFQRDKTIRRNLEDALDRYIREITQVHWKGYGAADNQIYGSVLYRHPFVNMLPQKLGKKYVGIFKKHSRANLSTFPAHDINFSIKPENFDEASRKFIQEVFYCCGIEQNKKILLYQPFSAINPHRSFKYFDDPLAIIVDRDPCDLYLLAKRYFHPKGLAYSIPTDTVGNFITYYRNLRKAMYNNLIKKSDNVLIIRFEDMVYRFDETRKKINEFCGLNDNDRIHHYFEPKMSIANTQLIRRYPDEESNLILIKDALNEFLYDFEQYGEVDTSGQMFNNRSPLNK